jgi:hypothetical protein
MSLKTSLNMQDETGVSPSLDDNEIKSHIAEVLKEIENKNDS